MSDEIRAVLERMREGLAKLYGPRLKAVFLFGSQARGEANSESDIDVLIVLDRVENYSTEIARTSELIGQLSLECGRSISRVFVPEQSWLQDRTMFLLNVREEGVPV